MPHVIRETEIGYLRNEAKIKQRVATLGCILPAVYERQHQVA